MLVERPNELFIRPNPLAMWSFGLGVAGFFLSAVVVGGLVGIVAIILGMVALRGSSGKSYALGGIVSGSGAIAASLVAWVVWTSVGQTRDAFYGAAAVQTTKETIGNVKIALKTFEVDTGRFPTTEEGLEALMEAPPGVTGWRGPYLERVPVDVWGWPLVYRYPADNSREFELFSVGPDGEQGTGDDVPSKTETADP